MPKFEVELYVGLHLVGAPTDVIVVTADNPEEAAFFALGQPLTLVGQPADAHAKVSSSDLDGGWRTTVLYRAPASLSDGPIQGSPVGRRVRDIGHHPAVPQTTIIISNITDKALDDNNTALY